MLLLQQNSLFTALKLKRCNLSTAKENFHTRHLENNETNSDSFQKNSLPVQIQVVIEMGLMKFCMCGLSRNLGTNFDTVFPIKKFHSTNHKILLRKNINVIKK